MLQLLCYPYNKTIICIHRRYRQVTINIPPVPIKKQHDILNDERITKNKKLII